MGNTLTQSDPRGGLTRFVYDALDRKVKVTDPVGSVVSTGYDGEGNVVSGTDAAGVVTTHGYDGRGLLTVTVENARVGVAASASTNVTTTVGYDSRGLQAQVRDPRGNVTSYAHDALGRLTGETDALGRTTATVFDGAGQRVSVTAGDGSTTSFGYTPDGYVARVSYPDKSVVSTFDALGRRVSMTDPVGVSAWVYDWAGRVTSESDAHAKTTAHVFDLVGNQVKVTYPDGRVVSRVFDGRGLASKQSDASGATSFTYDATGALVGQVRASGVTTALTRDLAGRVTSIVHTGRGLVGVGWPFAGLNPSSAAPGNAWGHCKDNGNGHVNQEPAGCGPTQLVFAYTYDPRGLVAERDVTTTGTTTPWWSTSSLLSTTSTVSSVFTHDDLGRLTASVTGDRVSGYSWDASSNLVGERASDGGPTRCTHDGPTRCIDDGHTTSRSVNAVNEVTSVVTDLWGRPGGHPSTTAYTYDARGNRVSEVATSVTGNKTHLLGRVTNTFDGMDLLTSTTDPGGHAGCRRDDSTTRWVRDGLGRALNVSVGGVTRQRTYDGLALLTDGNTALNRDPSGGVLSEATTKTVWRGWGTTTTTSSVDVLTDVLGSTVSVAAAGVISADLAVFDDFGAPLSTPRWDTVTGFTGQVNTSGLLEFAARTYGPTSRTWLQDDIYPGTVARSSSLNRYTYVEGAPETFVDAYGFHRAAAALQHQRLAADETAKAAKAQAAQLLFMRTPTCRGYYGCYTRDLYQQSLQRNYSAARSALSPEARRTRLALIQVQYATEQAQIWRDAAESSFWTDGNGESVVWNALQSWGVGSLNGLVTMVPNLLAFSWNAGPGSLVKVLGGSDIPYWTAFSNPNHDSIYGASYLSGEILGPQILIGGPLSKAGKAGEAADALSTSARLDAHVGKATSDYASGTISMTAKQARAVARNPGLEPAFRGQVIDRAVKNAVRADPNLSNLWVSQSGEFGPDFHDIGTNTWWDVTTRGQFQNHLNLYSDPFGTGIGLFTG